MKQFSVSVPKSVYDQMVRAYGNAKLAEDIISLKLEKSLRKEKRLIAKRTEEVEPEQIVHVFLKDTLYEFLLDYCLFRNISKRDMIIRIMKRHSR